MKRILLDRHSSQIEVKAEARAMEFPAPGHAVESSHAFGSALCPVVASRCMPSTRLQLLHHRHRPTIAKDVTTITVNWREYRNMHRYRAMVRVRGCALAVSAILGANQRASLVHFQMRHWILAMKTTVNFTCDTATQIERATCRNRRKSAR